MTVTVTDFVNTGSTPGSPNQGSPTSVISSPSGYPSWSPYPSSIPLSSLSKTDAFLATSTGRPPSPSPSPSGNPDGGDGDEDDCDDDHTSSGLPAHFSSKPYPTSSDYSHKPSASVPLPSGNSSMPLPSGSSSKPSASTPLPSSSPAPANLLSPNSSHSSPVPSSSVSPSPMSSVTSTSSSTPTSTGTYDRNAICGTQVSKREPSPLQTSLPLKRDSRRRITY